MSRFRVLQFNLQFGQVWDEVSPDTAPVRLEDTLAELRRHDADVMMLQEVERAGPGGAQPAVPPNYTWLRERLPDYHGYFSYPRADPRELPFGIGLALLSRTPLRELQREELPSPGIPFVFNGERRTPTDRLLIGARTTIAGRDVQLLNTHLLAFFMLGSSSVLHPGQREQVAARLAAARGPTILAGDFNVRHHASLVAQFATHGFVTVQDRAVTWRRQPLVLDHIFHNAPLRCVRRDVVPTRASDHHAVVAEFEFAD